MFALPMLTEFAPSARTFNWRYSIGGYGDETHQQIMRAEAAANRSYASLYDIYNEMEDKDGHLFATLQTRKIGILSRERRIVAHGDEPHDVELAKFIELVLNNIRDFDQALYNLLDALAKGFAVLEIIWDIDAAGRVVVRELKSRAQSRFIFGSQGELRLLDPIPSALGRHPALNSYTSFAPDSPTNPSLWGIPVPPRKFLIFTFNAQYDNPYGKGLCARAYWYYWFKKNNLKFWAIFNEKFGSPTVVARYRPGIAEEEHRKLLQILESLQTDTGITLPDNIVLEFLEAHRSGNINSYKDLADWCNDEISKIVLGQTLTSSEGRRSGSLALGRVHQLVRFEYMMADARALMNVINGQLIPWIVYFNFGLPATTTDTLGFQLPQFVIDTTPDEELERQIDIDRQLISLGVPLPLVYFYQRYKRPVPLTGERALRYDDNNLYQYHLQYGVLTINEVRATLGLPPVEWGDQRPLPVTIKNSGRTPPLPTSRADRHLEETYPELEEQKLPEP